MGHRLFYEMAKESLVLTAPAQVPLAVTLVPISLLAIAAHFLFKRRAIGARMYG